MDHHATETGRVSAPSREPAADAIAAFWEGIKHAREKLYSAVITAGHVPPHFRFLDGVSAEDIDIDQDTWQAMVASPAFVGCRINRPVDNLRRAIESMQSASQSVRGRFSGDLASRLESLIDAHASETRQLVEELEALTANVLAPPRRTSGLRRYLLDLMLLSVAPTAAALSHLQSRLAQAVLQDTWKTALTSCCTEAQALAASMSELRENPSRPMALIVESLCARLGALHANLEDLENRSCAQCGKFGVAIFNRRGRIN